MSGESREFDIPRYRLYRKSAHPPEGYGVMKYRFLFLLLLLPFSYLLLPLSSRDFSITVDQDMLSRKKDFLTFLRNRAAGEEPADRRPPNILIILADDLGKTDISAYGSPFVETPHIDALGEEGVRFNEAYCTAPICAPSRASLLTGRYQQRFGFELQPHDRYPKNRLERALYRFLLRKENWVVSDAASFPRQDDIKRQGLPPTEITLGELFRSMGYATGIVGKWHLGTEESFDPNNRGFDYQFGFYEAFSLYADIDDPDIVNFRHDHFANRHIWKKGRTGSSAIRRNGEVIQQDGYLTTVIAEESVRFIREHHASPFLLYVPFSAPHTPFQVTREYHDLYSHVQDPNKRVYYAMIRALDDAVGAIMESLREQCIDEETLVFFASDNGGATYTGATDNGPLKGGKFSYFEGGLNVPFMMRWKGHVQSGREYSNPVSLMDIFTTAVSAASGVLPADRVYDGVDLLPFVAGEKAGSPHESLLWRADFNRAVRRGAWKLIVDSREGTAELYNLEYDKGELFGTVDSEMIPELQGVLRLWEEELMPPLWPKIMDYRFTIDGVDYFFAI
jgi:arylsulfatase A-like enzyme